MAKEAGLLIPVERVEKTILVIRGQKVVPDADLAALYGVTTSRLNEQVKRNAERFSADFMFQLTQEEYDAFLRCQIGISRKGRGGCRYFPMPSRSRV